MIQVYPFITGKQIVRCLPSLVSCSACSVDKWLIFYQENICDILFKNADGQLWRSCRCLESIMEALRLRFRRIIHHMLIVMFSIVEKYFYLCPLLVVACKPQGLHNTAPSYLI